MGLSMSRVIEKVIKLHRVQYAFRHSNAPYRAFCGGRGAGKSFVGAYDLIRRAERGRTYMIVGPTYPNLRDSSMRTFLQLARDLNVLNPSAVKLSAPPQLTLSTGAEILFRSADDPEKLRGPNLSGIWLDEASLMSRDAYDICIASLREGGRQGFLTATFTPKGPSHWTHELWGGNSPNTALFRAPTSINPFLPPGFHERLKEQFGETLFARQELGGEFVQLEGAEFPAEWFLGDDLWFEQWPDDLILKVIALDPSKGTDGKGKDYQAHVMVGVRVEEQRYVLYVDADLQREGVTQMCERTLMLCRSFGMPPGRPVDSVVVEENGTMGFIPQAFDAAIVKHGTLIPYICRVNTDRKESRIRQQVSPPLSRRQIRFRRTPGARMLVGQLQSWPRDEFDDAPDALSTALKRVAELLPAG